MQTAIGEEKEAIGIAYNGAKLEKNGGVVEAQDLNNQFVKNGTNATASGTGTITVTFPDTNRSYTIDIKGKISEKKPIDWDAIIADANANPETYKNAAQQTSSYIGIGTNGEPVNMDLWACAKIDNYSHYSLSKEEYIGGGIFVYSKGYLGSDFDNIIIPQYIKGEDDECFKEVTSLDSTFHGCTSLITAPTIPSSVTNMSYTFGNCTSLITAPTIPPSVTDMFSTFGNCTSLITAPTIPSSVTNMSFTFENCASLITAPTIPPSVTDMSGTFKNCTSLITAPTIPSSVTDMAATFKGCTSLTGTIIINANPTIYNDSSGGCFEDTIKPINLIGDSTILQELANTANNGNVEVQ